MNILTLSRPGYFGRYVEPRFEVGRGGGVGGMGGGLTVTSLLLGVLV